MASRLYCSHHFRMVCSEFLFLLEFPGQAPLSPSSPLLPSPSLPSPPLLSLLFPSLPFPFPPPLSFTFSLPSSFPPSFLLSSLDRVSRCNSHRVCIARLSLPLLPQPPRAGITGMSHTPGFEFPVSSHLFFSGQKEESSSSL